MSAVRRGCRRALGLFLRSGFGSAPKAIGELQDDREGKRQVVAQSVIGTNSLRIVEHPDRHVPSGDDAIDLVEVLRLGGHLDRPSRGRNVGQPMGS